MYAKEVNFASDGMISAFRFRDGHVDFKNRWVRTEKMVRERRAREALFGKYRNGFTDNPAVAGALRTTSNTNIVHMYGRLLALKEDGLPYELDPHSLRTKGVFNFEGQYTSPTFTAHPKVDPITGETIVYGYQAKGDGTKDVAYFCFDRDAKKTEEFWFEAPYSGLMHDIGITPNYGKLPASPQRTGTDVLSSRLSDVPARVRPRAHQEGRQLLCLRRDTAHVPVPDPETKPQARGRQVVPLGGGQV